MFTMTPMEGSLWTLGVSAQTYIASTAFGNVFFTVIVFSFFGWFLYKTFNSVQRPGSEGLNGADIIRRCVEYTFYIMFGLMFLRQFSTTPFTPKDYAERDWSSYSYVSGNPKYEMLRTSQDGLRWYLLFHKAGNELSDLLTGIVNGVFGDTMYYRSPGMMFKMLVNTATVQLDDPAVTKKLERLAHECSDTANAMLEDDTVNNFKYLIDTNDPECRALYDDLKVSLKSWASRRMPSYLDKALGTSPGELPASVSSIADRELLENKVIASALIKYAESRAKAGKDGLNTNVEALGLNDFSDRFWFNMQRTFAGGSLPAVLSFWKSNEVESGLVRNEAGIMYNNLLNLIPSIKGYIRIFICLSFLMAAAALACGFLKPSIWWVRLVLMEALYEPLSTLNYQFHTLLMNSTEWKEYFTHLQNDPMALMGASLIDNGLLEYETTYFITQMLIVAAFVFGIIQSGWAVRQMSFSQGAAFGSALGRALPVGGRLLGSVGKGIISKFRGG